MKLEHFSTERAGGARWNFGKLYVEHSSIHDATPLADNLRSADRDELAAVTIEPPVQVLIDGIRNSSPCYTIRVTDTGRPCGVFGTRQSDSPGCGVVWMLGTDDLTRHRRSFLRYSRRWLKELHNHYDLLYNVIDARNKLHIRWLQWMGFEFDMDIPKYGIEKRHFIFFKHYERS